MIDLGPGGGVNGGEIVAEGPPEAIAQEPRSFTGQYLKPLLERAPVKRPVLETKPKRTARTRKARVEGDELCLETAK